MPTLKKSGLFRLVFSAWTCHFGLDNLIALANEELSHSHNARFSAEEYKQLVSESGYVAVSPLGEFGSLVDSIGVRLTENKYCAFSNRDSLTIAEEVLGRYKLESHVDHKRRKLVTYGMTISCNNLSTTPGFIDFQLYPPMLEATFPAVKEILQNAAPNGIIKCQLNFDFPKVSCMTDLNKLSGLMYGLGVKLGHTGSFIYDGLRFTGSSSVGGLNSTLKVFPERDDLTLPRLADLISLLFRCGVFFLASN